MNELEGRSIIIIGGGASGVILALHLLKSSLDIRVMIVEKRPAPGRGVAYSTKLRDHLLNVYAHNMSAFQDDPEHFCRWLAEKSPLPSGDSLAYYAPRNLYGEYLGGLITGIQKENGARLRLFREEAISVTPLSSGVEVQLASGASLIGHIAVLAVGHDEGPAQEQSCAVRIDGEEDGVLDPEANVLILGTGLSMVDAFLTLESRGHRGQIIAVSRRGLLPSPHRPSYQSSGPIRLDNADIPFGTNLSCFLGWLRDLVRSTEEAGGDWRDAVDGLRPFSQRIWQSWPASTRRRFLRHTKAWWDIHRHRMAPTIYARVALALKSGRLTLIAARLMDARPDPAGDGRRVDVKIRHRHSKTMETLRVARIYDCTGIVRDIETGSIKVIRSLIDCGFARPDPLRLGLDVTCECAVIAQDGLASEKLFAIGPLTRSAFFEIDAIPEIRRQCETLARHLAG
ncbi:FAD-dependent oxidoreductase [Phyllobacterium salinisoli]|uniref:FAD-dependent oxidoreductase n=2 Tax=Phyllobacterium salinisoli TaxID=1899321 RepID=A0A368JWZ9_9HYPH|nr:FAD/NAD(P)-binding protein [Phyllobacterium salinisoli]RCS21404.1 FAD-dependent oxidoreductase [Phyllobacterium salinisoli]